MFNPNFNIPANPTNQEAPKTPEFELNEGVEEMARRINELKDSQEESVVVLVAGGSASGKTSAVAAKLKEQFGDEAILLSMDDYYRGKSFMEEMASQGIEYNWDQPEALNLELFAEHLARLKRGESVDVPNYNFAISEADGVKRIESRKIIIVEGLFALNDSIAELGDLKAFVKVGTHGRILRRLMRDVERTGQLPEDILAYFAEIVEPMNEKHIDSTAKNANLIIDNEYNPKVEARGRHEVQVKYQGKVDLDQLRSLGAVLGEPTEQEDVYYQPKDRDLSLTDELLRIRKENSADENILTYKGPKVNPESGYRERPMLEFPIDNSLRQKFIDVYGAEQKTIIKSRVLGELNGVSFSVDNVRKMEDGQEVLLGDFVEVRSVSDAQALEEFKMAVGLGEMAGDTRAYCEM